MNHGNSKKQTKTWHMVLMEHETHKNTKLPNRSPEPAVTKTQLSLGRKGRRRIWSWSQLTSSVSSEPQFTTHSWGVKLSPRTQITPHHKQQHITTHYCFLYLLSHTSAVSFSSLSKPLLLIKLLIRNHANDPKTKSVSVGVILCKCAKLVLKNATRREKLFKGCQPSSSALSSSSIPSWEKRQRGGRQERIRVSITELVHWKQHGKKD